MIDVLDDVVKKDRSKIFPRPSASREKEVIRAWMRPVHSVLLFNVLLDGGRGVGCFPTSSRVVTWSAHPGVVLGETLMKTVQPQISNFVLEEREVGSGRGSRERQGARRGLVPQAVDGQQLLLTPLQSFFDLLEDRILGFVDNAVGFQQQLHVVRNCSVHHLHSCCAQQFPQDKEARAGGSSIDALDLLEVQNHPSLDRSGAAPKSNCASDVVRAGVRLDL
mmetsp:Transcript_4262/g.16668  ORF Transcript_4262/g.16668 Transcript_4262/m.16668 type:complete len:221 (-) Transcript_4262:2263-2925(-)